MNRKIEAIKGV